ncbi:MAG: CHAT domain-containing protein [Calditrichota bacterium]
MMCRSIYESLRGGSDSSKAVFPRLDSSGVVARRLQSSFGKGSKVFLGLDASEERLRGEKLAGYDYHLFATHGILDNTLPYIKEPALVLTLVPNDNAGTLLSRMLLQIWKIIKIVFLWLGIIDEEAPYEDITPGFLTLSDVMNMEMGGEVVALTACNTGVGKNLTGEGVMGLGRAFQYAGARAVLMSLWSVEDVSTNIFTEKYFGY